MNKTDKNLFFKFLIKNFFCDSKTRLYRISPLKIDLDKYLKINKQSFKKIFFIGTLD